MTLTDDQRELLEDKFLLWDRASREGSMELRDYNRRAADAIKVALSICADTPLPQPEPLAVPEPAANADETELATAIRCLGSWVDGGHPGPYAVTDLVRTVLDALRHPDHGAQQ